MLCRKAATQTLGMTSQGLGEMFEGDIADMCGLKFPLVLIGAERSVTRAQTWEQGLPSTPVELNCIVDVP